MANKKIVFVHGSDDRQADTPWMFYHFHPSEYTTPVKDDNKTLDVVLFDFSTGTRKTWNAWKAKRSRSAPPTPDDDSPLLPRVELRDYDGKLTGEKQSTVESFYRWVKIQPARSIVSIQVFSHATIPQPILFPQSYEWGDDFDKKFDDTADRDPHDTEFRLRDFEGNNPLHGDAWDPSSGGEIEKFRAALDPDAFIKIWGCGEQTFTHNDGAPIRKLVTDFLATKPGTDRGDARRNTLLLTYLDNVHGFFPYRLAERLKMPVWAGPVGWGSDPNDVDGKYSAKTYSKDKYHYVGAFPPNLDKKELWWRLSSEFRSNKKLADQFFKGALKAKMDGLGYVEYKTSWVNAAENAANAALYPGAQNQIFQAPALLMQDLLDKVRALSPGQTE
jgi:hypothetical protein